jgi:hypothetical protein
MTIPVYEIYKAGLDPSWTPGMALLQRLTGLPAVVVPHYDNAEGGGYDTRFCYLGEQRLIALEAELDDGVGVLGVDEHTACDVNRAGLGAEAGLDPAAITVRVIGTGSMTARYRGVSQVFPAGSSLTLAELAAALAGQAFSTAGQALAAPVASVTPALELVVDVTASLAGQTDLARDAFDRALTDRDVDGCVAAVLDLEAAIVAWSADTLQSDDANRARQLLRNCIVRLGELARGGARDPRELLGPYIEALLELRARARTAKDYPTSDLVRDRLVAAGVEVKDTPDGVTWSLKD